MKTQKQIVLERLDKHGSVDNFWAIHNYILRLSDIMFRLKNEGVQWEGKFGYELKKPKRFKKNYYYLAK